MMKEDGVLAVNCSVFCDPIQLVWMVKEIWAGDADQRNLIHHPDELDGVYCRFFVKRC